MTFIKKNYWPTILLACIIFLAAFLRFWHLGQNPPSLDWDETAHGYNAYSILKTGKDEYGYKSPLSFRSFDDYKPPIYTYLVVPSVAVFGLTDFAIRFPSATLGVLAVLFTYLMVYELFKNKVIALLSALFLAISPWHLQFSRVAFETNSATFWSVLATWAFLRGIRSNGAKVAFWMSLSSLAFGANLFMYHNARVFTPLLAIILLFLFKRKLLSIKKYLIVPALIAILFSIVLIPIVTSVSGRLRFEGTSIFGDASPLYKASQLIAQDEANHQLLIGKILHNRRLVYIPILVNNYLSHLNPTFLFFTADMDRHHAPQIGLLYLWDLPFIICGIYFLLSKKFPPKSKVIVFAWFLLAPVASSVTWGVPHALRSEIYLPTYQIFASIGVYTLYTYTKHKKLFVLTIGLALLANFLFYFHQYWVHMPIQYSQAWLYGRKQAAIFSDSIKTNYDRVIVSTKLEQPHEFWLYYLKYDPKKYLAEGGTVSGGFLETRNKFDKYLFKPIDFEKQAGEAKTLFVGLPSEFGQNAHILKIIYYLNGEPAIYIADK
ncbi:hypothetical protein A3B51_00705 [Candidatus Curtissbacteria bacterium RIFCSPLOWO2_01_FULL_41_18]|uniref:Glycosyltransferase RgtA/B/C/D-like domain-containing protein n=1 Tax=Candidatus Curtissbacteria bacterium RIFCSPLOWO2_01_FULL_41_18 TaxID=1797727 RepID=A0A1F5HHY4_9BACT|nr:MAG: hypothetical protein A3B51_00705 [Candidatus Curtissbacteria bacterium RIFCSPLOWO2_01_FULL_41_18]